uniref:Uncharacterized membrane protein ycf78 n=1 Tax=Tupiella akineta TaxID=160070 RepID=YCF78_TUPAK|nr:hypothetical protein RF1 [Tupiella akineta]Q3ZJ04.1 RecName: Full=Uncharacterized membrane protein ycf78; AltName: Full=ycf1 [Tupiella akineta]AAV80685.1 hypothetical protein RF1 [Tupiella akineta]
MFFANALKDYIDQLNDLTILLNDNFTVFTFLKSLIIYLFDSIKFVFIYLVSCKWLTDFIELPCTFKSNYTAILEGKSILETNVTPSFFHFLETKPLTSNSFLTGFLNSFFLTLPFSVPHLLSLRAFLINGLPAGISAALGTILGQFTFFICVFFGFEGILIPFLTFEPLNYILGFVIVVNVLYNMAHKPNMEVLNKSQLTILSKFFGLNFVLSWTEQTSLFHYCGNLTFNNVPTLLQSAEEGVSKLNGITTFFLPNFLYLVGILLGSFLWTALLGFLFTIFRNGLSRVLTIPFMFLNDKIHKFIFVLTFTFCLTSIPYYGFDYLVSAPLGFIGQDRALEFFKAKPYYQIATPAKDKVYGEVFLNPIPFDRTGQLELQLSEKPVATFEDYSVDSENAWRNRQKRRPQNTKLQSTQTSRKTFENKERNQDQTFIETFYKSIKITEKSKLSKVEKDIDQIASKLFNPIAYDYYDQGMDHSPYTRKLFREKFYNNPVYKSFVHLDMISFLQGQPESYNLTAIDEAALYRRRFLLENYLASIHDYKDLILKKQTNNSYAENVYNQQFKGSLDLVRHYFSISLTSDINQFDSFGSLLLSDNQKTKKILKFDQPLYKNYLQESNPILHEELDLEVKTNLLQNSVKKKKTELFKKDREVTLTQSKEETEATPFYIGWDGTLRKFLVKKACTPGIPFGNEAFSKNPTPYLPTGLPTYLSFQSWPLNLNENNFKSIFDKGVSIPYTPLSKENALKVAELFELENFKFDHANLSNLLQNQNLPLYNWNILLGNSKDPLLPKNLNAYIDLGNTLPPQFGGFAWPGETIKLPGFLNFLNSNKNDSSF